MSGSTPVLTFKEGAFRLKGMGEISRLDNSFKANGLMYVTLTFKGALAFRQYADPVAEKVFKRSLVAFYDAPQELPVYLDPHQKIGINWILTRSRSYLAHAPGAGKTAQAITAAFLCKEPGQVLFVVPPALTANWRREILKFYDLFFEKLPLENRHREHPLTISTVPESSKQHEMNWGTTFVIVPDSMLAKPWVLRQLIKHKWRLVGVDEASRFKEASAKRTIALFGGQLPSMTSPGLIQDAHHAVLLDGSPMPNRPMELWAPTFAVAPEAIDFMDRQDFGFRYCGATMNKFGQWEFKHASRENELHERLQRTFMHVVGEEELAHPERRRKLLFINKDVRTAKMRKWEGRNIPHLSFADIGENKSQGDLALMRKQLGLQKMKWVARYIRDLLRNTNESILVFGWHREFCEGLVFSKELKNFNPGLVIGDVPMEAREAFFEHFQKGSRRIIVGNILAMGRGHNLQRADRVIFGEYSWSDEMNKQCEKRASRRGSDKKFTRCEYIVAPGSLDEIILQAVFRKAERVKRIIG